MVIAILSRTPSDGNEETTRKSIYQQKIVSEINDIEHIPEGYFPINLNLIKNINCQNLA